MSLKKNIGVLVLLLVLLSMSAVSAEDVSINTNDTYQAPNEIQKDFTSLQTDIDNSQNVFELNYDVKHGDDEKDNYGISITKTTIINGNGHTIDANGHGSIFVVKDSSVTLTLNDLTLINANPVSDSSGIVSNGGAVYFDGSTLIVNNVNFKNNTVYKYGGAIYTTGTCIVDSSVFDGNDVQFRSQNTDNGGAAIYADNGASLLISNSQIINNHKNMVIRDNNVGDLVDGVVVATGYTKISKSYFRNNSGCYGGAVTSLGYTNAGKNQIIIENSVFDSNRAFQGAAVNVIGSTFKISGTNFTNNKGVGYGSGNPNVGALLTWYSCEGTISDCNFINNTADNGAAYRLGDDNKGVSSASVDSCTFINNTASNQGGAVYEGGTTGKATLDIKNSIFTNNSAKKEGSAIYSGYTLNIDDDTTFTNNMVYMYYTGTLNIGEIKTFTDLQKAINMVEGDIYLSSNVTMLASEADNFVNGIVVDHLVNLKCDGFTINANNLGRIFNVTSTADKLNIYNANLINGNADIGGAAIYNWYDGTLTVSGSNFTNNIKNYKNGDRLVGAVATIGDATISDSCFVNNAGRWGGAITTSGALIAGDDVNTLTVSGSTFKENGGLYGAGIFVAGSDFTVSDCVFDKNTAFGKGDMTPNNNNGAAIVVTDTGKDITGAITGSKFTNNKAQYGGAIYICEGNIAISDSLFENNSADVEGGAIDINTVNGNPEVSISGSKFINNSASYGGAIVNVKDLTVRNTEFVNNIPDTIFNYVGFGGNLDLGIENFTDLQNAIGLVTGTLTLNQNVVMTDDEAANFVNGVVINKNIVIDGKGHTIDARDLGRIFSIGEGFTVTLTNATLINGKATEGGAIYNDGSLTLSDVKLSDNAADGYGGAVFNNGELVVSDSVFDSNNIVNRGSASVDYGGAAIYNWKEGTLKVTNSNFTNNIKNYKNGDNLVGAITTIGNATVSGSNFVNNSGRWGGAISATGAELRKNSSTLTVSNTIFRDNAALYAGAVYIWGSNYNIADCVFDNNTAFGKGNMTPNNNNGGALVVSQVSKFNEPITGTISGSKFTNNKAQYGGAAYFNKGFVTITDSVFENNIATAEGGAVGFSRASVKDLVVSINNSSFVGNKAPVAGAIFTNVDSKITNSNFTKNTASKGGAVLNENGAKLTVDNSTFKDNAADSYGGAVLNNGELIVTNSVFDANDILNRGSAGVDHGGAAIYNWENAKLDISKSNFTNNIKNYVNGDRLVGAVTTIGNATIRDSYFVNNSGRWGGALAATGGVSGSAINTISVDGTKFVNNTALYGGALIVTQDNIPVSGKIVNSNFTNNKAQYGGAAWINEGTVDIDGSNFINNTATTTAGAIGFDSQYTKIIATVDSSKFVNNTAGSYAGAIYNLGDLTVSGSEFDNNKAQFGDIIYNNKIYNKEGILSINGNKYSNYTENKAPIINIGDINTISSTGGIIVTVLDNKTVNVCYGDVVTLHATVVADGVLVAGQKLFFVIDNVEYIANSLGNGSYIASYEVKDVGSKTVGIVYDGSDVNIKTGMLNISKATPDLTVGALNITVGDLEIITVTGPKDATGLITLTLNGIDYILPIYNGEAKFYFQDLTADEYEVSASYSGDNHYVAAENSTVFKVDKVLANLKINVEDITFGENGLVIITLPSDIDGSVVTVNVNGKVYPVTVENGFAKLPLRELNAGDYTISAVFAGNDKYLPGVSNALLTVSKADPALNVFISDVDYYGAFNINVALTGVDAIGLNGDVIVTVNGKDYTVNVVNGKGNVTGVKLAAGTYDFTAKFAGDNNYNDVGDSGNFKVNKVDSAIDVAVSDIKVGEDAVITVKLLSDATGSVTVTVNGKDYTEPVVNGIANVKVSGLKADTYDVAVKYSGDNNYNDAVATSSFTVSKVDPTMDVTADDIVFGEDLTVNAVLSVDATGKVVIVVDGTPYTVNITYGKATQVVKDLTAGYHTVGVKYDGDDKYNDVVVDGFVIVDKAQPVLGVVIADVNYGNEFAIEATLTGVNSTPLNGNVIVTVNGKFYVVNVTDGKGTLTGVKLAAGTYGFTAVWAGNDNYAAVDENGDFKVNKLNSTVAVNADDIKVGENVTVSVNVPSDATGNVIVTVDGKDYTVAIVDGKAVKTISDLKANNYTVTVKYDGDNNYNANQNTTKFTVSKISDYNMNITVPGDVKVGEDAVIIVNVPKDASGNVTVSVGKDVYNAVISNGSAKVVVSGLGAGVYNVSATFADDKYAQNKANATVVVSKVTDYNMNVSVPEFKEGVNSTISVDLPKDATGTVTVEIDGKKYTANVTNGTAKVNIPALSAGNHNITTTYSGDAKYDSMTKKGNITVIPNVNLDVNDVVMFYHDGTRLVAKLTDSQGKPIVNATIYFNINGVDYAKSTDDNGTAYMGLNLDSNVYAVTVTYNGSDIYSKISKNVTVTINPSIIAKDLVKMYQNDTKFYAKFIGSDGKALVNTTVRFNIHGVFYNRTTNDDGIAELGIMLRPGNYILTAYNPVTGEEQGFNITVKSLIVQNDLTKYYLNASKFEATIYDKNGSLAVNKTVTFNIHGVFYTRSTDDKGVVSLGISLRPGEYIITTIYEGLAVGNNITVLPTLVTSDLNMTHEDGSNFTAQTLDGQGKPLANQNVTFNINGVFYNKVTDENGVASLAMRLMSGKYIITSYWNDFQTGNTIIIS